MVSSVNTDGQLHELTSEQRNALIAQYMPLARSIAAKKHRQIRSVDIDELRSAAYLGLVEAASRYESARGNFYSYAVLRIGGEVQDCLRSLGFGSKGSVSRGCQRFASLDAGGDGETSPVASVEATGGDLRVVFDEITEVLPPQGKKVMWLYYVEGRKMKEIGDGLGLAESRVSQLIAGYKKRLRAA